MREREVSLLFPPHPTCGDQGGGRGEYSADSIMEEGGGESITESITVVSSDHRIRGEREGRVSL